MTDKLRIDFLELPKTESDGSIQIKRLKKWMRFFNIKTEEDADMIAQANDTMINKAVYVLREMSADERTREMARQREKRLHDEASYLETARIEGETIGEKRGIIKGRAEGRVEGTVSTLIALIEDGIITLPDAADRAGMSVQEFKRSAGITE